MNNPDQASVHVVDLAKTYITFLQANVPGWSRAFFRSNSDEAHYGSTASYESNGEVALLGAINFSELFRTMNESALAIRLAGTSFKVLLLTVSSDFDYKIDFEQNDANRWCISKMDGLSGIPVGVQ